MSKIAWLREMRERRWAERNRASHTQEEHMATKASGVKKVAKKKAPTKKPLRSSWSVTSKSSTKPAAKKAATKNGGERPGWINVGLKRPITTRTADVILKAAGDKMAAGATVQDIQMAIGGIKIPEPSTAGGDPGL